MSKKRINPQEPVLLSQTATDKYLRVIKVYHAQAGKHGSACTAATPVIESTGRHTTAAVV